MFAKKITQLTLLSATSLVLLACNSSKEAQKPVVDEPATEEVIEIVAPVTLAEVIAHPRRAHDSARDKFRNPQQTLEFFEVGPGQTVAEIWPGWYTDITAPYLADNGGTYVAVLFPEGISERLDKRIAAYQDQYSDTDTYGEIQYGAFAKGSGPILPPESVDTLLTFRNVHNWMSGGYFEDALAEFYAALKPGGILGIVEHRLPETAVQDPNAKTGYVQESYMKDAAKRAGFEFVASSEVNANPKDTADHVLGVWTLPPRSRVPEEGTVEAKDFNAELYKNIGESDRATLKFRKPL